MRILITNDDGINARGLKVLESIARGLSRDVWIAAPETEQSGASHSLTLYRPLRVRQISRRRFAVDGTPTDCVMLAIHRLVRGKRPDLLLSGINRGSNLADDLTYSGTVAAAFEATLLGVPAIALSQHFADGSPVKWATAEHHAPTMIRRLVEAGWPADVLINVNFPDRLASAVTGAVVCRQGRHKFGDVLTERLDPRGRPYYWIGSVRNREEEVPGSDIATIESGAISITPLCLNLTHASTSDALREALT
ncbi:MAG: 5'/3'-nucleotidase SurE [Alphaproteobacteria bacterium]